MSPVGLVTLGPKPIGPLCRRLGRWLWKLLPAILLRGRVGLLANGWGWGRRSLWPGWGGEAEVVEEGLDVGDALDCWQG